MPIYLARESSRVVEDIALANRTWQMIVSDQAPVFLARKGTKDF